MQPLRRGGSDLHDGCSLLSKATRKLQHPARKANVVVAGGKFLTATSLQARQLFHQGIAFFAARGHVVRQKTRTCGRTAKINVEKI